MHQGGVLRHPALRARAAVPVEDPAALSKNSLFAILLRSPWWVSFAVAGAAFALTRLVLSAEYALYAGFFALPFAVIGCVSGWRQLRAPNAARVAARLEALRALSWEAFGPAIEEAFRRQGYEVARCKLAGADLELTKGGRVTLVNARRWKAARTGTEPLRELDTACRARDAQDCIYVAAGDITGNATAFAAQNGIRLLQGAELAELLRALASQPPKDP